jgi:hypothetical protein
MATRVWLRRAAWTGLIAGVAMLYLAAVGLVESFIDREVITDYLTLGRLFLLAPPLIAGFGVARRLESAPRQLGAGLVAGAAAGIVFAAGFLLASALSPGIRDVLIRITPPLLSFIAYGLDPVAGALLNVAISAGLGLAGAAGSALPARVRQPIIAGALAVILMSMVEPFLRPRLLDFGLLDFARWLYVDHGLSLIAAVVIFIIGAVLTAIWTPARAAARRIRARGASLAGSRCSS